MERVQKEVSALHAKYKSAMAANNSSEAEKAKIDYQAILENSMVYLKNFVKEHPKSVVSAYICEQHLAAQINESELEEIVKKFPAELDSSEYVIRLKARIADQKRIAIGAEAPDFTMNDPEGKPIQLSSLRGKIVLLDFWASWCMPCRQENPNIVRLYNQYQPKGFEILGVSLDRTKEKWVKAIQDDKLTWKHVSDLQFWQNEAARLYAITVIPQSVLIGKDGKIIAKGLRGEELEKKLAEVFAN
jgi:peroxiredoxin